MASEQQTVADVAVARAGAEPPPLDTLAWLRPRSGPEVVDAAVQLLRRAFKPLLVLAAVNAAPGLVLGPLMARLLAAPAGQLPSPGDFAQLFALLAVWAAWHSVGSAWLMQAASDAVLGRAPDAPAALRRACARAVPLIDAHFSVYLRAGVAIVLGFVAAGIVAAIAMIVTKRSQSSGVTLGLGLLGLGAGGVVAVAIFTRYVVMTPVIMLEGLGARAGLARAAELTQGNRRRLFLLLLALYGTTFAASAATQQLLEALLPGSLLAQSVNSVLWLPVQAFVACVYVLLYYDLRVRREGFDIELLAGQLPARAPA